MSQNIRIVTFGLLACIHNDILTENSVIITMDAEYSSSYSYVPGVQYTYIYAVQ